MKKLLILIAAVLALGAARADEFQDKVDEAVALKEDAAAVTMLEREIYRGNLKAALQLGKMYRAGDRVTKDPAKAIRLLRQAAKANWMRYRFKLGLDEAQYLLGMMLLTGEGSEPAPKAAARYLEEAAKQGNAAAQVQLAEMQLKGMGIDPDPQQAWIWARLATDYLTGNELKRAESIRDAAAKQLNAGELAQAKAFAEGWFPRSL